VETLTFGPLKPVGLVNPKTGKDDAYAVVQLRQDNKEATLYNLVGFQTNLKWGEQKRVFSMIPGLDNAEFVRYGVMHRNTYINSPKLLDKHYRMREYPKVFFAGQITGVEGYVESASSGILAGYNMAKMLMGEEMFEPDNKTCIGALPLYISNPANDKFQPMNANFGIIEGLGEKIRNKAERYNKIALRALDILKNQIEKGDE
ncbi:MAG: methylenetetrahydrofolate--tRNA-(uracil(54)-C(5))-methyltransferase (FADH(2)-oxidizing) TrmFO, partial [Clostridia bacterium]|nr:methylenetetrahydrofolate--tRNA-(uracil(54)-C(5))-methyltransferase (FADH(2)-oxidizing) TrmFO [Clostridia bacterium]